LYRLEIDALDRLRQRCRNRGEREETGDRSRSDAFDGVRARIVGVLTVRRSQTWALWGVSTASSPRLLFRTGLAPFVVHPALHEAQANSGFFISI